MFGSVGEWMYQSLGGIHPTAPGFGKVVIKPQPVGDLSWVNCSYESVNGTIVSNWKKEGDIFELQVTVLANTSARIYLPSSTDSKITENGRSLKGVSDMKMLGYDNGFFLYGDRIGRL